MSEERSGEVAIIVGKKESVGAALRSLLDQWFGAGNWFVCEVPPNPKRDYLPHFEEAMRRLGGARRVAFLAARHPYLIMRFVKMGMEVHLIRPYGWAQYELLS